MKKVFVEIIPKWIDQTAKNCPEKWDPFKEKIFERIW